MGEERRERGEGEGARPGPKTRVAPRTEPSPVREEGGGGAS